MTRQTMIRSLRCTLVAALLGALLTLTAGVVSAAAAIVPTPGTGATPSLAGGNTFDIAFTLISSSIDVDCGDPAVSCSVWVAKNNAAKATEALFTNVTGKRTNIAANFINDGCVNFRLYDAAHTLLVSQLNLGHRFVCKADGSGQAVVLVNGSTGTQIIIGGGKGAPVPSTPLTVDFDSGFAGGVDEAELWIDRSLPSSPYSDCTAPTYPNSNEVLYTRNASGEQTGLNPVGGGPYCFTLYQGSGHLVKSNEPVFLAIGPYMTYSGGTAVAGKDNAGGTVYFNSGNSGLSAIVCVYHTDSTGSSLPIPFVYNSQGYGNKMATFQTPGAGENTYYVIFDVNNLDAMGNPTQQSCAAGAAQSFTFFQVTT
jgi:hypothetical protein